MKGRTAASALLAALVLVGCTSGSTADTQPSAERRTFPAGGALTVDASELGQPGSVCLADDGYADIRLGATVTVRDASGTTVALGALDAGLYSDAVEGLSESLTCIFGFAIEDIPEGGQFYSVEVSHRGAATFTRAQFDGGLQLKLG